MAQALALSAIEATTQPALADATLRVHLDTRVRRQSHERQPFTVDRGVGKTRRIGRTILPVGGTKH